VIRILVEAPQEYVNTYSTRRVHVDARLFPLETALGGDELGV